MSPPKIRIPGLVGRGIPQGYVLGRLRGAHHGDVQLLDLNHLRQFGVASGSSTQAAASIAGFTFNEQGLMTNKELLGTGSWAHDVTFTNDFPGTLVTADYAAAATAALTIWESIAGTPTHIGDITFTAGGLAPIHAVVTWVGGLHVVAAGNPVSLYGPTPADLTLGGVHGTVEGYRS